MSNLLLFIISVLITEAITEIVSKSVLFTPVRAWFFKRKSNIIFSFIHDLLDCGFCLSVWVGTLVGLVIMDMQIVSGWIDWFIVGLLIHKCSNITHNIIDRTRRSDY